MTAIMKEGESDFWIFRSNLLPAIIIFSKLSELEIDEYAIDHIKYGLIKTSSDTNAWYKHDFSAQKKLMIEFSVDTDDNDIIFLKLHFEMALKDKIDICAELLQDFNLEYRHNYYKI